MRPDTPQRYEYITVEDIKGPVKNFILVAPWKQFYDLKGRKDSPLSYSDHLQPDFAGNYGKETFKNYTKIISSGLVGWGFPIRTEGICEYVVVNIKKAK